MKNEQGVAVVSGFAMRTSCRRNETVTLGGSVAGRKPCAGRVAGSAATC
jgi:hypothetical protein